MKQGILFIHLGPHARFVIDRIDAQIAAIDNGSWHPELLVDPEDSHLTLPAHKAKAAVAARAWVIENRRARSAPSSA